MLENFLVGTVGVRRDRVLQEQAVFERDARGVFPDLNGSTETLTTNDRGRTYSYGAVLNANWDAIDLNRVPNPQWGEFKSTQTEGYEFQLVGNPTSNLRLMLTGSKNITTVADRGALLFAYIARNLPEWQAKAATPVNSTLGATVGALATLVANEAANDKVTIGIRQTRSSEWQFSGVARYRFDPASRLKGFAAGSAFMWRDEPVIGYKVRPGSALFDITQPFFGAKTFNVDAWVDYSRVMLQSASAGRLSSASKTS